MTEDLLKNLETELIAWERSKSCLNQYPLVIKRYVAATDPESIFTRQGVSSYLALLTKEGKASNTKRFDYYIIKKFFQANNHEWPFPRGAPPKPLPREVNAPTMPSEDVERLITNRDRLDPWEAGIIALSTTFGLRQEEVLRVNREDIKEGRIFIHTVKHGVEREHLLPEVIAPYVGAWASLDDRHRPAKATLFVLFHSIARRAGVATPKGMGLHSLRRELATRLLQTDLNPAVIYQFLRWQLGTALGILGTYSHIPDDEADRQVFQVHPWLPLWS